MKNVLITGGASGLGYFLAKKLSAADHRVISIDKKRTPKNQVESYECDVTNENELNQLFLSFENKQFFADAVINCAGLIHNESFISFDRADLRHSLDGFTSTLNSNLVSCFLFNSFAVRQMVKHRTKGAVVNFSSISAKGAAGQTAYAASKGAIESLTKSMALELGPFGIRVNAIAPGYIETESTRKALKSSTITKIIQQNPLEKLGHPEHVFDCVSFLISCEYVNGTVIQLDGGQSASY